MFYEHLKNVETIAFCCKFSLKSMNIKQRNHEYLKGIQRIKPMQVILFSLLKQARK